MDPQGIIKKKNLKKLKKRRFPNPDSKNNEIIKKKWRPRFFKFF